MLLPPLDVTFFLQNDPGYISWLASHPNGFVVNSYANPTPGYLKLHRATCGTIAGTLRPGRHWTQEYLKSCSDVRSDLRTWGRLFIGADPEPCRLCMNTLLAQEGLLPSQFPEVQGYPHLLKMLQDAVDLHFDDLRTILQLPTAGLNAGCNFTAAARLFDLISGASVLFYRTSPKKAREVYGSGEKFRRLLRDRFPWADIEPAVPRVDAIKVLYDWSRNLLAHSLGIDDGSQAVVLIDKAPMSIERVNELETSSVLPTWTAPAVRLRNGDYVVSVSGLYWGVHRMLHSVFGDATSIGQAEQVAQNFGF